MKSTQKNNHKKIDSVIVSSKHHLAAPTNAGGGNSSSKVYSSMNKNSLNNSKLYKNLAAGMLVILFMKAYRYASTLPIDGYTQQKHCLILRQLSNAPQTVDESSGVALISWGRPYATVSR